MAPSISESPCIESEIQASACGKVILCGEHAVVYGQPALALPLPQLRASAVIRPVRGACRLVAPDLELELEIRPDQAEAAAQHTLVTTLLSALGHFELGLSGIELEISSQIPIGRGLGSGTAISAAIFRAVAAYASRTVERAEELAFIHQIETLYHGRPSGIDGAIVSHEQALCFVKGSRPRALDLPQAGYLLIADSGLSVPTHVMVNQLRERHDALPHRYELLFTAIGEICRQAEITLQTSALRTLGRLLSRNHHLLQEIGVSSPRLDQLVQAALAGGALGAKLSGGGGGGVVIALCLEQPESIEAAWRRQGVERIWRQPF